MLLKRYRGRSQLVTFDIKCVTTILVYFITSFVSLYMLPPDVTGK